MELYNYLTTKVGSDVAIRIIKMAVLSDLIQATSSIRHKINHWIIDNRDYRYFIVKNHEINHWNIDSFRLTYLVEDDEITRHISRVKEEGHLNSRDKHVMKMVRAEPYYVSNTNDATNFLGNTKKYLIVRNTRNMAHTEIRKYDFRDGPITSSMIYGFNIGNDGHLTIKTIRCCICDCPMCMPEIYEYLYISPTFIHRNPYMLITFRNSYLDGFGVGNDPMDFSFDNPSEIVRYFFDGIYPSTSEESVLRSLDLLQRNIAKKMEYENSRRLARKKNKITSRIREFFGCRDKCDEELEKWRSESYVNPAALIRRCYNSKKKQEEESRRQ